MPDHPSWPAELVEKAGEAIALSLRANSVVGLTTPKPWAEDAARAVLSALSGDLVPREQAITRAGPNTVDLPPVDVDDLYDAEAISNLRSQADALAGALAFYADSASYEEDAPPPGALDGVVPIKEDAGGRARSALASYRSSSSTETEG